MFCKLQSVERTLTERKLVAIGQALALLVLAAPLVPRLTAQNSASSSSAPSANAQPARADGESVLPRGKKLMLKDGSFHLVREYQVQGDRVRYYSIERSAWEEIPSALVDWDATKSAEAEDAERDAAVLAKVHKQEAARLAEPIDIDASLEVAPGIFLPPGERLFAFDGKAVLPLPQAETTSKLSKGHLLEQVLVPVPVVPSRRSVSIAGARAKLRLQNGRPEFYFRTANAREPEVELIRAKVHGEVRQLENLDELWGAQRATHDTVPMQRWEIAHGVYRFTLGQALPQGEYALAEIVQDENMSLYVWDFGVDEGAASNPR
ncbi:MAG TPA: hypothetical protein VN822_13775 [Candidatus Acidoferrales bacterium]|nr:hypothetical protein [Candidatus Acidoferrales bacterium]